MERQKSDIMSKEVYDHLFKNYDFNQALDACISHAKLLVLSSIESKYGYNIARNVSGDYSISDECICFI